MTVVWALVAWLLLRLTGRWIHRHLQQLGYRVSGSPAVALALYAILLFPGVLLHEVSHWATARLAGVRTGRLSLIPRLTRDGDLQLGSLEYSPAGLDPFRESLIGAAPLLVGCGVLLLIVQRLFGIAEMQAALTGGQAGALLELMVESLETPDLFLWLYLAFAVANAMVPSPADRRAWPALALVVALVVGLLLLGLGSQVVLGLTSPLSVAAGYLALALTFTVAVNLLTMTLLAALEQVARLAGR